MNANVQTLGRALAMHPSFLLAVRDWYWWDYKHSKSQEFRYAAARALEIVRSAQDELDGHQYGDSLASACMI